MVQDLTSDVQLAFVGEIQIGRRRPTNDETGGGFL